MRHDCGRDYSAAEAKAAGFRDVDTEVTVPAWTVPDEQNPGQYRHARLDVCFRVPPEWQRVCLDLVGFHPFDQRGRPQKSFESEARVKHERYPTNDERGQRLTEIEMSAVVFSTLGSFGPEAMRLFERLKSKGRFGRRFVSRLALVVVKVCAQQVLSAWGRARATFGLVAAELPPPPPPGAGSQEEGAPGREGGASSQSVAFGAPSAAAAGVLAAKPWSRMLVSSGSFAATARSQAISPVSTSRASKCRSSCSRLPSGSPGTKYPV